MSMSLGTLRCAFCFGALHIADAWMCPGGTYWVQWHDGEIIGDALPQHTDADVPARLARAEEGVPPVAAAAIDPSALAQLVAFGFDEAAVQAALIATGGDMNAAANMLMG